MALGKKSKVRTMRELAEKPEDGKKNQSAKKDGAKTRQFFKRKSSEEKNRRFKLVPGFFSESISEIKQVSWPNFKMTIKLTVAVIVFALVFSIFIAILDYILDKLFREVIIG